MGKSNGRKAAHADEAKQAKLNHEYGSERGLLMQDKAAMCTIAQVVDESAAQRDKESKLAALMSLVASTEKSHDATWKLLEYAIYYSTRIICSHVEPKRSCDIRWIDVRAWSLCCFPKCTLCTSNCLLFPVFAFLTR